MSKKKISSVELKGYSEEVLTGKRCRYCGAKIPRDKIKPEPTECLDCKRFWGFVDIVKGK